MLFYRSGDQFENLREVIYSEVATLISQNESRPQFLLELFRELQLLSSDYLRARALQAMREVLNKYLTEETETEDDQMDEVGGNVRISLAKIGTVQLTRYICHFSLSTLIKELWTIDN